MDDTHELVGMSPPLAKEPKVDLESEWTKWQANPTPDANAKMLNLLEPTIGRAMRTSAPDNALTRSKARSLALGALSSYNPKRGRLESHIYNHMQGLKRYSGQLGQSLQVPERLLLDRRAVESASTEMNDELGREPTIEELANRTGFSTKRIGKIRGYSPPMAEGFFSNLGEGGEPFSPGVAGSGGPNRAWMQVIYDDLGPLDQKVFEYALGWQGAKQLSNQEIAAALRRSPGWVSQRKALIQSMIDKEQELSPFGG